jgi:hypothetical protein
MCGIEWNIRNEVNALIEKEIKDLDQTVSECEIWGNAEMAMEKEKEKEKDENGNLVFFDFDFLFHSLMKFILKRCLSWVTWIIKTNQDWSLVMICLKFIYCTSLSVTWRSVEWDICSIFWFEEKMDET